MIGLKLPPKTQQTTKKEDAKEAAADGDASKSYFSNFIPNIEPKDKSNKPKSEYSFMTNLLF